MHDETFLVRYSLIYDVVKYIFFFFIKFQNIVNNSYFFKISLFESTLNKIYLRLDFLIHIKAISDHKTLFTPEI